MTLISMRSTFDPNKISWVAYYQGQAKQSGHGMQMFHGVPYQRGSGLGSIFKGLFRAILPMAKSAGKTIGKEALSAGLNIAGDALGGKNIKIAAKRRSRKAAQRLVTKAKVGFKKQTGSGIGSKRKRKATAKQQKRKTKSPVKRRKRSTVTSTVTRRRKNKRRKHTARDIFG